MNFAYNLNIPLPCTKINKTSSLLLKTPILLVLINNIILNIHREKVIGYVLIVTILTFHSVKNVIDARHKLRRIIRLNLFIQYITILSVMKTNQLIHFYYLLKVNINHTITILYSHPRKNFLSFNQKEIVLNIN